MAFKGFKLSPELEARIAYERREISRLHALPDRWLARDLLRMCREIRNATVFNSRVVMRKDGEGNSFQAMDSYNSTLLWDVIPEVARRLGAPMGLNESMDPDLRRAEGQAFRDWVANCLVNVAIGYFRVEGEKPLDVVGVLFHDYHNGNPVAFGLDRLVPPTPESDDRIVRGLREVTRRRGHGEQAAWAPGLSDSIREADPDASAPGMRP